MSKLNQDIRNAIAEKNIDKAHTLLREALVDADAETWFLASQVALDDSQKHEFLQKALNIDPFHRDAYKAMSSLNSSRNPEPQAPKPSLSASSPNTSDSGAELILEKNPKPESKTLSKSPQSPQAVPAVASSVNAALQVRVTGNEAYLYRTPEKTRRGRELLSSGMDLDVIARDYNPNWINVAYRHGTETKIGWIEAFNLNKPRQRGGKDWDFSALPITYYQYNTHKELKQIETNIRNRNSFKGLGIVFAAIIFAFFAVVISVSISEDYGYIIGWIVSTSLIIASLYLRASSLAPLIRQIDVLQRLRKTAPQYVPSRYIPYTGWAHPLPEQIKVAEEEHELDRQKSRRTAIRNAGIFALIGGGWLALLYLGNPDEASVNFAVFCICVLALLLASPVIHYFAVYASDQEKAMALVGVVAALAVVTATATKAQGGAIQRRKEQEAAAAKARADAEQKQREEEQKRKAEELQKLQAQKAQQHPLQQGAQDNSVSPINYNQWRDPWGSGRMLSEREYEREHDMLRAYADHQAGRE